MSGAIRYIAKQRHRETRAAGMTPLTMMSKAVLIDPSTAVSRHFAHQNCLESVKFGFALLWTHLVWAVVCDLAVLPEGFE